MVARKTRRSAISCHAARLPDDRAVIGCAVTALAVLLLMLLAGVARAEQPGQFCSEKGGSECESVALIGSTH